MQEPASCAQMGIFITHNRWGWSLSSCQAAVCFPGDSCCWDSIPGFSKCHRKKHGTLAHSCINFSLELITFQKTTHGFASLMKITHYHCDVLCCDLTKATIRNDFEPAQSYFLPLILIFIGSSIVSLSYKLDSASFQSIFNSKHVVLVQCYSNKSLTGLRTLFYKVQRQRERDK